MAKYRDRIFEMYEFREEAIDALMPKVDRPVTDANSPRTWPLTHLAASNALGVTVVKFKQPGSVGEETVDGLRDDFALLPDLLDRDSKVLLDFTGVPLFAESSIDTLILLNKILLNRGSRIALCELNPATREFFNSYTRRCSP